MKLYKFYTLILCVLVTLALTGCNTSAEFTDEILTHKKIEEGKIPITVLVKYAFSINNFEKIVEDKFPNLDLVQVGNYTQDMGINEYEARLKHDDLTDIVLNWPLDVGSEYWDDRLIDLASLPITGDYVTSMLDNISLDGKLYYLPGPSQVRGIVYNKTLFKENNWSVPKSFDEFIDLCQTIEKTGIRALQLGLKNPEVLDTAFIGYSYENAFSKPKNAQWINDYNNGNGKFEENFSQALDTFQTLIDEGILTPQDLEIDYAKREQMIFNRKCAMIEDSVLLARMGESYNGCKDEFAIMPFFNPGEDNDWARLYPVCYIGLNKKLSDKENKEKYNLVMDILEYISTPEGQLNFASDTGATFSSLKGVPPPNLPEITDLLSALNHGRYGVFPVLKNVQDELRKGLTGMVLGEYTKDDVSKMIDKQNLAPKVEIKPTVLATAKKDFTLIDTGNYITDLMRKESGSDIALYLDNGKDGTYNGKGISGRFYKGDITTNDVLRILPDYKLGEKGELWKVTLSGKDLLTTLEYSIPVNNNRTGWFYYFSGLKMEFDPVAQPGSRIKKITDSYNKSIDPNKMYTVTVIEDSIDENYIASCDKTNVFMKTMLENELKTAKSISPPNDNRFKIIK